MNAIKPCDPVSGTQVNSSTCVFNRGVVLINSHEWRRQRITEHIEGWLRKFKQSPTLWHHGKCHHAARVWLCQQASQWSKPNLTYAGELGTVIGAPMHGNC